MAISNNYHLYVQIFNQNQTPEPSIGRSRSIGRVRTSRTTLTVAAKKRIEGVCDGLNSIAMGNMDFSPARRKARDAFLQAQQNLDHFLFKKAPTGIQMDEKYEINSNGLEIFWKSWFPSPGVDAKAALFFCHGYGDTCTFFFEGVAKRIANAGYQVYAMDYPGFGLSQGLHGHIPSFDTMVDHVIEQYDKIRATEQAGSLPHFLLGQSMGGAVALKVHLKQPKEWDGILLAAPMCKISEDVTPPRLVLNMMAVMSYVLPEAKLFPQKDIGDLAFRDPSKRKMAEFNVISYSDQMRLKTAVELIKATQDIESQLEKVCAPLLILHGAADKITDPRVSKYLYGKASTDDKTLKLYEESYHSILEGEPDDRIESVISDIISCNQVNENWLGHLQRRMYMCLHIHDRKRLMPSMETFQESNFS